MLYKYVWVVLNFAYRCIFTRVFVNKVSNFPGKGPVILAVNHTNAFLDAVILAALSKRSLNFLVRSDVFNTAVKRFFLRALHQIPIYRERDGGRDVLQKNQKTFKEVYDLLERNRVILIFPEADCHPVKRLRPLKKGAARMAFGAMEKNHWNIDPVVVPVGINYTYHTKFRTEIFYSFNTPISVKKYEQAFKESEAKAIKALTKEIETGIQEEMVIVDKGLEEVIEQAFQVYRSQLNYSRWKWLRKNHPRYVQEKQLAEHITRLKNENPEEFRSLEANMAEYVDMLQKNGLTDFGVANTKNYIMPSPLSWLFSPVAVIGRWINKPVLNFAERFIEKNIKKPEFIQSIRMGLFFAIYHSVVLTVLVLFWVLFNFAIGVLAVALFYLMGFWSIQFFEILREKLQVQKARKFARKNKNTMSDILRKRSHIMRQLNLAG